MKDLLKIQNQGEELLADSRHIADLFGIDHESLCESIDRNKPQLEQLGILRFETGKYIKVAGRPPKFVLLTFG